MTFQNKDKKERKPVENSLKNRIIKWFEKNNDMSYPPSQIRKETGFPKCKYDTLRKYLSTLRREGFIRYAWDSRKGRELPGYYECNTPIVDDGIGHQLPDPTFHNLKLEFKPVQILELADGKKKRVRIDPQEIIDRLNFVLPGSYSPEKSKPHCDVFKFDYLDRDVTITVQKGKSDLIEIFLKASDKSLILEEYINYHEILRFIFTSEIFDSSPIALILADINRDFPGNMGEYQHIKYQDYHDHFIAIYQKKNMVRAEGKIHRPLNHVQLVNLIKREKADIFNMYNWVEGEEIKEELKKANKERFSLRNQIDKILNLQRIQSSRTGALTEMSGEIVDLLTKVPTPQELHPGIYQDNNELKPDDLNGYG